MARIEVDRNGSRLCFEGWDVALIAPGMPPSVQAALFSEIDGLDYQGEIRAAQAAEQEAEEQCENAEARLEEIRDILEDDDCTDAHKLELIGGACRE